MSITIPVPVDLKAVLWFGVGAFFARALGKRIDWEVQQTTWFKGLSGQKWGWLKQIILQRAMDCLHHWYIGLFLVVYASQPWLLWQPEWFWTHIEIPLGPYSLSWLGWGVFADDAPDLYARLKEFFPKRTET